MTEIFNHYFSVVSRHILLLFVVKSIMFWERDASDFMRLLLHILFLYILSTSGLVNINTNDSLMQINNLEIM